MGATLTTVLPLLREHYRDNITEIFFTIDKYTSPILVAMESKSMSEEGYGRGFVTPVEYGEGSSVSATFSVAQGISQAATTGSTVLSDRWVTQAMKVEGTAQWSRDALKGAQGDSGLFDVMSREMDSKIARMRQRLAICAVEGGWGRVGTLSAVAATTLTFASTSVLNRIQVGDRLVAAAAEGTGNILTFGADGIATVSAINPDTGVVTVTCTGSDVTAGGGQAWTATSVIFFYGDRSTTAAAQLVPAGLRGWINASATGAWMGVTRTGIPQLLGYNQDATGLDHPTALIRAVNKLQKFASVKPDAIYTSSEDYATLSVNKDATKIVEVKLGKYEIAFGGVAVNTNLGPVPVIPDMLLEQGTAYAGPFGDKKFAPFLAHNDDLINVDDVDGNEITRLASDTAYEMRLYFRGGIICPAPGKFITITNLPTS
jgi:hypothetical protein